MSSEYGQKNPAFVRLPLSSAQKEQVRSATGREAEAIELTAQELEERIAPRIHLGKCGD